MILYQFFYHFNQFNEKLKIFNIYLSLNHLKINVFTIDFVII